MLLTFLGTGPATAIPRRGHRDPTCRAARAGGRSARTRSAAVVREGTAAVLIDAGPDIRGQLEREGVGRLDGIVITHRHADAMGGLAAVRAMAPVVGPDVRERRVILGGISVVRFTVPHAFDPSVTTRGFVFDRKIAYASDARDLPPSARRLLRGIDTLVLDGAAYLGTRIPTHLSADRAIELGAALGVRRLYLTQIGHSYPPHEIAERAIRAYAARIGTRFPVTIAYDGLDIKV